MMSQKKKLVFGIVSVLFTADILVSLAVYGLSRRNFLEVDFFDVGQGDAIFIQTPEGRQILIDGGPDSAILEKLGGSLPFWDRTIDLIVLTHPENDHLLGLIEVLKNYEVGNILWTGIVKDTETYKEWERLIAKEQGGKEEKANIFIAKAGQKIYLSEQNSDQYIEILYPFEGLEGKIFKDSNNTSIVNKLIFGENSFLFPGDIYKSAEKEILEKGGIDVGSDVLKISHHGSKTSSAEEFIAKVSPEVAVISAGKDNKYGHPSPETLEALEKYGITVLRTDVKGDIKIISNGKKYAISTIQN